MCAAVSPPSCPFLLYLSTSQARGRRELKKQAWRGRLTRRTEGQSQLGATGQPMRVNSFDSRGVSLTVSQSTIGTVTLGCPLPGMKALRFERRHHRGRRKRGCAAADMKKSQAKILGDLTPLLAVPFRGRPSGSQADA